MPVIETKGALSSQGLGEFLKKPGPVYIEDVFSSYLYSGNGSIQTINNGIALGSSYGGSVYFDGVGYLTVPDNAVFEMTGDFTVEAFFNCTAIPSAFGDIVTKGAAGIYQPYYIFVNGSGNLLFYSSSNGTSWNVASAVSFGTISTNTWYHVAVARQGSSMRLFLNGALITTITNSAALFDNTRAVGIGARSDGSENFTGYISNVRIVKGTAVYTAAFTVPTSPLTAVSGTSLLTCQSPSPTTDYSSNAFTVSVFTGAISQNGGGPFTNLAANKGGMVWIKSRSAVTDNALYDTVRGPTFDLVSNSTAAQTTQSTGLTEFNSSGFRIGALAKLNTSAARYVSWTFRRQDKFFDLRTVSHVNGTADVLDFSNLGTIGMVIFKDTGTSNWFVWNRTFTGSDKLLLNLTDGFFTSATFTVSGTTITVASAATTGTKVIYAFAHNAGGFGLSGTDNVISCGSYTGNGSTTGPVVTLNYEPQWILIKRTDTTSSWCMLDYMRGLYVIGDDANLSPNATTAEVLGSYITPTATGFQLNTTNADFNANTGNYAYAAIRRGQMKVPTSGADVFNAIVVNQTATQQTSTNTFPPDVVFNSSLNGSSRTNYVNDIADRLRSLGTPNDTFATTTDGAVLATHDTAVEDTANSYIQLRANGIDITKGGSWNSASYGNFLYYFFRRAAGFLDVVCYTGTGANATQTHNLTVVPELIIVKRRTAVAGAWSVYSAALLNTEYLVLNTTAAKATGATYWNSTTPTATTFSLGTAADVNASTGTYVAYLFATVAGVSKVGSYSGTGALQTINCGFTGGARFVFIKRTDSTGDWFVYDSTRGISSSNDPYFLFNSSAVQVTTTNYVDTTSTGFQVTAAAPAGLNANGGSYIFLAIA